VVRNDQPLIGIPFRENGQEVVRYFADETTADAATADEDIQAALGAIGAWSDLDWDEMEQALDRIRHESRPTPPIEL
jgi:hypothetical protein